MSAMASLAGLAGVSTASGLAAGTPAAGGASGVLPIRAELAAMLPWSGLRRGSTVAVHESVSLLFGVLAEATASGSWAAVVGMPGLNLLAAAEMGADMARIAVVPQPGNDLPGVAAALLDGVDLVVLGSPRDLSEQDARRLSARARHRAAVLLPFGSWPGVEVELWCTEATWSGLEDGHGRLCERSVTVRSRGRGAASRPRACRLSLPAQDGAIGIAADSAPNDGAAAGGTPERAEGRGEPARRLRPVAGWA